MTRWFALGLLVASCHERAQPARDARTAADELSRCTFGPDAPHDAIGVEAALRRAIRIERMDFAVRAGRCIRALDPALRQRDAQARALGDAWDDLLPRVQSATPDDIALERAIRHVGNAWRALPR